MTLPIKVSRKDFNRYFKPYLSVGSRGPDTKISTYKIFNHILRVLHTGMQWYQLDTGRDRLHWSNVYRHYNRWSKDGSFQRVFEASIAWLNDQGLLELFLLHGDGSNTVAKKGGLASATPATSTNRGKRLST